MNIIETLEDAKLLGAVPAFRDMATWSPWVVFLRALYGEPLSTEQRGLYQKHTGRSDDRPGRGFDEGVVIVGRQSGKTRVAAAIVAYEAAMRDSIRDGELYALLIAQDQRAALRAALGYVRSHFGESGILSQLVSRETTDTLKLRNGITVAAYPARPDSIRGIRAAVAVVDELAYFRGTDGRWSDSEMLRAVRPTLATTGGRLVILSSPYAQSGALYDLHRRHYGKSDSASLVWQASAPDMNPTLPADYLERMKADDPEAYRSEVLGEFRAGLSALFDPDALEPCVGDYRELPPSRELGYSAFVDPSGGRRDAFTLSIAHREGERAVVDGVRAWSAPFNPSGVVSELCDVLKTYRVRTVVGDRYAAEWPAEQFRSHGVDYKVSSLDRSKLYLELLPAINAERVQLPNDPRLLRELHALERQRGPSGRDRVDHPRGAHDDRANALAGAVHLALSGREPGDLGVTL